jgi:hypothetical protein
MLGVASALEFLYSIVQTTNLEIYTWVTFINRTNQEPLKFNNLVVH